MEKVGDLDRGVVAHYPGALVPCGTATDSNSIPARQRSDPGDASQRCLRDVVPQRHVESIIADFKSDSSRDSTFGTCSWVGYRSVSIGVGTLTAHASLMCAYRSLVCDRVDFT